MPGLVLMPGPALPPDAAEMVRDALLDAHHDHVLTDAAVADLTVVAGGMEDIRSPYLVLRLGGQLYFLLERRNDDGEWAALLYRAPEPLDVTDPIAIYRRVCAVEEYAQELTGTELAAAGLIPDDSWDACAEFSEMLSDTLYTVFRDTISPGALDD